MHQVIDSCTSPNTPTKNDVPGIYSGRFAVLAMVFWAFLIVSSFFMPGDEAFRPGILDSLVGIACGVPVGLLAFRTLIPLMCRGFVRSSGSTWNLYGTAEYWQGGLVLVTGMCLASVPTMILWLLCPGFGLSWPWCGAPIAGLTVYLITVLHKYAKWYESLPN